MSQSMRVVFDAGPGDAMRSLQAFAANQHNPEISHVGYSDQTYRVCSELGIPLLALCSHQGTETLEVGSIRIERRENATATARGVHYYAAHVQRAAMLLHAARAFRANVLMIPNEPHPALLAPARRLGLRVIQSLHCMLWSEYAPRRARDRVVQRTLRGAYRNGLDAVLTVSESVSAQVEQVAAAGPATAGRHAPLVEFLPLFRPEAFAGLRSALELPRRPFRVMFIGRLEASKGVFDLIEVARRLRDGGNRVVFDVCGDGGAMAGARVLVASQCLEDSVRLHGWCDARRLRAIANGTHAVIVPTTRDFVEGFNKTVIEGLLYGRPVITSEVCPAVKYVSDAVIVIPANDVSGYTRALTQLARDAALYERLCRAAGRVGAQFLDARNSYAEALRHTFTALLRGERPRDLRLRASLQRAEQSEQSERSERDGAFATGTERDPSTRVAV